MATIISKYMNLDYSMISIISLGIDEILKLNIDYTIMYYLIPICMIYYVYINYIKNGKIIPKGKVHYTEYNPLILDVMSEYILKNQNKFSIIKEYTTNDLDKMYTYYLLTFSEYESIKLLNLNKWIKFNDFGISGRLMFKKYSKPFSKKYNDACISGDYVKFYILFEIDSKYLLEIPKYLKYVSDWLNKEKESLKMITYRYLENEIDSFESKYEFMDTTTREYRNSVFDTYFSRHKEMIVKMCSMVEFDSENVLLSGIIPRVSYILYGEAGSGKSSLIQKMAIYLNRSIVKLELSKIKTSNDLESIFSSKQRTHIIVLDEFDEDLRIMEEREIRRKIIREKVCIDTDKIDKKKVESDEEYDLTIKNVLSIFQGVIPRIGLILFATTNKFELIRDKYPELVRYGRLTPVYLTYPNQEELNNLSKYYYGKTLTRLIPLNHTISMSQITEMVTYGKQCDWSFEQFEEELFSLFNHD